MPSKTTNDEILDTTDEVLEEEQPAIELDGEKEFQPIVKIPKWLRYILMFLPSILIVGIILIIDWRVGFPDTVNPIAIIAITGIGLFAIVVLGDMVYRNIYVYRMIRTENKKSKIYKQIIKERKEEEIAKERHEFEQEDEYEYDEDEEEEPEEEEYEEEYEYTDETDQAPNYRMKSYIFRGGIFTILIVNSIVLLALAVILQLTYAGGFTGPGE